MPRRVRSQQIRHRPGCLCLRFVRTPNVGLPPVHVVKDKTRVEIGYRRCRRQTRRRLDDALIDRHFHPKGPSTRSPRLLSPESISVVRALPLECALVAADASFADLPLGQRCQKRVGVARPAAKRPLAAVAVEMNDHRSSNMHGPSWPRKISTFQPRASAKALDLLRLEGGTGLRERGQRQSRTRADLVQQVLQPN
jgi:hypothetical protein